MANRFPLVIDTSNENKISELPAGDNLNLSNSDISAVQDIYVQGTIYDSLGNPYETFSGDYNDLINKPVLFSGDYADLANKPSIPNTITDLNILDGQAGEVLTTDGAGNFTFEPSAIGDYNQLANKPVIPSSLTDLGIADGFNNQLLKANGNGTYEFITLRTVESFNFLSNEITVND